VTETKLVGPFAGSYNVVAQQPAPRINALDSDNGREPVESPWSVDGLRFTSFYEVPLDDQTIADGWAHAVQGPPDNEVRDHGQQATTFTLAYANASPSPRQMQLIVNNQDRRADWHLTPMPPNVLPPSPPPLPASLGPLTESVFEIRSVAERWTEVSPPSSRLAFGAVLSRPASDLAAAFTIFRQYFPTFDIRTDAPAEFLLQFNDQGESSVAQHGPGERLVINRIHKWAMAHHQALLMNVSGGHPRFNIGADHFLCMHEMDINTPPGINIGLLALQMESASLAEQLVGELCGFGIDLADG